ncbi:GGDEF domain-containing protein [Sphingomonas xanthus]|uniref:diguanylate cyclase n=1 Tax=Sphingomonas xanthus TaxID=2594473 RepID=A0A516IU78_9SPHN|nr:GGDEF domain-containing protein [Sphingomonas xanthus]QDP20432.1 GGDEF domain-containing protein [Sphingomonas xanthus]
MTIEGKSALPSFPKTIVAASIGAIILMLGISSYMTWHLGEQIRTSVRSQTKILTAAERLEHYGSVLELSIKAVVATGDPEAAARYRAVQPQLRETLKELRTNLEPSAVTTVATSNVNSADLALTAREFQALDLASRGRLDEAKELIHGEDYNRYLKIYYGSIAEIEQRATEHFMSSERRLDSYLTAILTLSLASFLFLIVGTFAAGRPARSWARELKLSQERTETALVDLRSAQELLKAANQNLFEQARVDALTGVQSRRKFNEDVENVIPRALQDGESYSLIMCDVDNFKLYNDNYGHLAGDEVLRSIADAFKAASRYDDQVYRYGGEEFVLLLKSTSLEAGKVSAERFRAAIEAMQIPHVGNKMGIVTVSMGLAQIEAGRGLSIGRWVELADKALYEAKRSGRNRVENVASLAA